MPEKIEIIYDFDGFANPGIKKVELSRINGYKTIITKEGEKEMEEYKLSNLTGSQAKKILELADQEGVNVEDLLSSIKKSIKKEKGESKMTEKTNDEIRFNEEEKKVEKYLEDHKSENLTYRDAVVACLDRSEPAVKKEFTEEEKENVKKEEENIKKVEKYISENPEVEYRTAVLTVLGKGELNENELKVEEYIEKCKSQGIEVTYREAVLKVLPLPKKEE